MSQQDWKIGDTSARRVMESLQFLLRDFHPRNFAIELWDGTHWLPEETQFHRFTWKIHAPDTLWAVISSSNREVALAEQYISGNFDIAGDMEAVFPLADYLIDKEWNKAEKLHFTRNLLT